MKVEVIRGEGDRQADDIIDELCTADNAGLQRGRNFLDENGFDKTIYDINIPQKTLSLPGAVVEVSDASLGQTFRAKLQAWTLTVEQMEAAKPVSITMAVSLERSLTS